MTTVTTQTELDAALAANAVAIYIESDAGVWLTVKDSGSSHVVARDSSHVDAWGSSHVDAWGSSHVDAWGSSHVVARDSSHVDARDSSHVDARDSSHVDAWDSSHVDARDSSHVVAAKYTAVHLHSQRATLDAKGAVIDMTAIDLSDPVEWCEVRGVKTETLDDVAIAWVYKAVNDEWTTGRGTSYAPGATPEATDWARTGNCGHGLHFGVTPSHSAEYYRQATRYVRVGVRLDEMETLGDKCKARRVVVACVEVNRYGREVVAAS